MINARIPKLLLKKIYLSNIKNLCSLVNIRMINLSFDELKLIAQVRNIDGYENKSKEDLIKELWTKNGIIKT